MERDDEIQVDGFEDVNHTPVVLKTKFFPWHKPRKQFIRVEQWNAAVSNLITALRLEESGRNLEYLSLPGADLLDVRALYPVCEGRKVRLKFTGLNHIPQQEQEMLSDQLLSLGELRGLDYIDSASDVHLDRLESLSKDSSIAYQKVIKNKSTYDVVNIDLCDTFLGYPPLDRQENYYNALFKLLRHQAENRDEDWLFFITSRTNKDMVDPGTFRKFIDVLESVFAVDEKVYQTFADSGVFSAECFAGRKFKEGSLDFVTHSNIIASGIGKWLLGALLDNSPAHSSKMLKSYLYDVSLKERCGDMFSLAFWCKKIPTPAKDPIGLAAGINLDKMPVDEHRSNAMCHVAKSISQIVDVDAQLDNSANFQKYLDLSVELMRSARYHPDEYSRWAIEQHSSVTAAIAAR